MNTAKHPAQPHPLIARLLEQRALCCHHTTRYLRHVSERGVIKSLWAAGDRYAHLAKLWNDATFYSAIDPELADSMRQALLEMEDEILSPDIDWDLELPDPDSLALPAPHAALETPAPENTEVNP